MNGIDLKIARVRAGVRQFRVAAHLGITQSVLCAIENGRRPVTEQEAEAIARAIRRLAARPGDRGPDERAA